MICGCFMLNQSLSAKEPEKKMHCILDVWAPWMTEDERKPYVTHVWGLDFYQRLMTSREIGERLGVTNAERQKSQTVAVQARRFG